MKRLNQTRSIAQTYSFLLALVACAIVVLAGCNSDSAVEPTVDEKDGENSGPPPVTLTAVEFDQKMIAEGLNTPAGLAVQPESGDVFVSTIDGVIRLESGKDFAQHPEIVGFDTDLSLIHI